MSESLKSRKHIFFFLIWEGFVSKLEKIFVQTIEYKVTLFLYVQLGNNFCCEDKLHLLYISSEIYNKRNEINTQTVMVSNFVIKFVFGLIFGLILKIFHLKLVIFDLEFGTCSPTIHHVSF